MSLHNGIDTMAIATSGVYSSHYGAAEQKNLCNLYTSRGFFEDAPLVTVIEYLKGLCRLGMAMTMN